jgi:predicted nucleic-acid-binding Zn-ribbon protein
MALACLLLVPSPTAHLWQPSTRVRISGKCPKCGSSDLLENTRIIDHGHLNSKGDLEIAVYEKPEAWIFKGERAGVLRAWICNGCGFTELYCVELE